jgi:glycosyl transferase family 25
MKNVYYINLKHRTDRKIHVESQLNSLGWSYQRFNAIQMKSGRVGCSMSHLKLLQMAKEKNLPYIVILEDDIHFTNIPKFQELLKHFMDEIKDDYDVYLLAGNLRHPIEKITQNILKIYTSYTTTGYIVKQHYYDTIISNIKEGIVRLIKNPLNGMNAIDVNWIQLQKKDKWFISYPRTVTQLSNHFSNIENRVVNYDHLMLDQK